MSFLANSSCSSLSSLTLTGDLNFPSALSSVAIAMGDESVSAKVASLDQIAIPKTAITSRAPAAPAMTRILVPRGPVTGRGPAAALKVAPHRLQFVFVRKVTTPH